MTSTKRFVWIGNDVAEERDGSNNVTKRFFGEGEQIGGTAYLFTRDHLGSVREMVDLSGIVQARYAYDPYGRRTKVSGSLEADFGFTGHYYHAPSQLHLALYRAYDAGKGRWISRDPLENAEIEEGLNLYGYVHNEPVNQFDPFGLDSWTCGPVTYTVPFTRIMPGEEVHESKHRDQFWNGDLFKKPGWKLEQEAYAAQAKALKEAIDKVKGKGLCVSEAAQEAYENAKSVAEDDDLAKAYYNAAKPWMPHVPNKYDDPK